MSIFFKKEKDTTITDAPASESTMPDTTLLPQENLPEKNEHPLLEIVRFAIIALIIVLPIRWFVAQPFIVSGASMEETFHGGEYLIVDQLSYYFEEPQRGDVIIFRYPADPSKFFIKRLIGLPGDTIIIDGNVVTIRNKEYPAGVILDEPYINTMQPNTFLTEVLQDGEYFVMGDNRDASSDSRRWGILSRDKIIGRAFLRLFPLSQVGIFPGMYDATQALEQKAEDTI